MMEYFGWDGEVTRNNGLEGEDRDLGFKTCWFGLPTMQPQGMSLEFWDEFQQGDTHVGIINK